MHHWSIFLTKKCEFYKWQMFFKNESIPLSLLLLNYYSVYNYIHQDGKNKKDSG